MDELDDEGKPLEYYLEESFFWSQNAWMAREELFVTYQTAVGDCITRNPVGLPSVSKE